MKIFSEESKEIIASTKQLAERFENNFISVGHFILCFNKYCQDGKLQIRVTLTEKKHWIKNLKGKKYNEIENENFPLTKQMEFGLKSSKFHCSILGENKITPEHIYLGILSTVAISDQTVPPISVC